MIQTIVAIERDGLNERILTIQLDVLKEGIDLRQAVIDACTEYARTPEGKKLYECNCGCFNWADFESSVPNEICEKHGFVKCKSLDADITVDWDEHLVDDSKLKYDKDQNGDLLSETDVVKITCPFCGFTDSTLWMVVQRRRKRQRCAYCGKQFKVQEKDIRREG